MQSDGGVAASWRPKPLRQRQRLAAARQVGVQALKRCRAQLLCVQRLQHAYHRGSAWHDFHAYQPYTPPCPFAAPQLARPQHPPPSGLAPWH